MKKTPALDISNLRKAAYAVRSGKTGCTEIAESSGWSVSKAHGVLRHLAKTGVLSSYRTGRGSAWVYAMKAENIDEAIEQSARSESPLPDDERWQVAALEQAMPRPAAIAETLALQVTPRKVELGIAP